MDCAKNLKMLLFCNIKSLDNGNAKNLIIYCDVRAAKTTAQSAKYIKRQAERSGSDKKDSNFGLFGKSIFQSLPIGVIAFDQI